MWSNIRVCILSKGVRIASVQPARNAATTMLLLTDNCLSLSILLYCSNVPNIRAVLTLFCSSGGRMPLQSLHFLNTLWMIEETHLYKLTRPSALSCDADSQAEMPCSCCLNIVLLTGKVRAMLMMPLPQPATYSRHSLAGVTPAAGPEHRLLLPVVNTSLLLLDITTSFTIILTICSRLRSSIHVLKDVLHIIVVAFYDP